MALPRTTRRALLRYFLPLIFLSYFGTLTVAALLFPQPYDWRYRVISNLLSPRDDPRWYRIPSFGIAIAGLLMLPLAGYLEVRLRPIAPHWARLGKIALRASSVLLILSALVVPQHVRPVLGLRHLHEALSRLSALGFALAMLAGCVCAWRDRRGARRLDPRLLPSWCALTLLPLTGLLTSETLLLLARQYPPWSRAIKDAMRHSVFWHIGFWEWTGSAAVLAFLVLAVWLLPHERAAWKL